MRMRCLFFKPNFISHTPVFKLQRIKNAPNFTVRPVFSGIVDRQKIFVMSRIVFQVLLAPSFCI